MFKVPIARSDVHIHLKRKDVNILFGKDYQLTNLKNLTIPGQFACSETVSLIGPSGRINGVVVVGPERPYSQVEISITNGLTLGIDAPVRLSGDLKGSAPIKVTGPAGSIDFSEGLIVAARHIHMHSSDAAELGVKTGDSVSVRVPGPRGLVFNQVIIKAGDHEALEMHVDFDEGHAAGIEDFQEVEIIL
ncbi:MAG TPA: propanediol utilization protein [Spirochaeta sp.]|nr:propanediol utilization protein [Spirochaeta sp.]